MKQTGKVVKITDTTLRDAHQSRWATRMRTDDILPIADKIDQAGYHSIEMWGGATFDVCLRFLNEDPWERLRLLKKVFKKTPLQMLLRGQNIIGYKNYPDDVLEAFIVKAAGNGIDIFRIFDALNDVRNLEKAIAFVKREGKHVQGNICYTRSPVHNMKHYLQCVSQQVDLGIDSLCIKDMAGILTPYFAHDLVKNIKEKFPKLIVQLHCHSSSGMATAAYLKAVEAGVDIIDCASAPLALYTSQPAVETLLAILKETSHPVEVDSEKLKDIGDYFEEVSESHHLARPQQSLIDVRVITHQIPGGMASNLISQLEKQKALTRLEEVLKEIPVVREELGYPPLVTPTSQVVGTQAVFNVLLGERYKIIPDEVKAYVRGYYGRPPAPINEELKKKILGDAKPITCRPADMLPPGMEKAKAEVDMDLVIQDEDIITFAIFPQPAIEFFKWRKNPHKPAPTEEQLMVAVSAEQKKEVSKGSEMAQELQELVHLMEHSRIVELSINDEKRQLRIKRGGDGVMSPMASAPVPPLVQVAPVAAPAPAVEEEYPNAYEIKSPMVGTFYEASSPGADPFVKVGDEVAKGQTVAIIEAMKLMNEIHTETNCRIVKILAKNAETLDAGQGIILVEDI